MAKQGQLVGYGRVSSTDQHLDVQREALTKAGCTKIFEDKASGAKQDGRPGLAAVLDYLREGDTLIILKLDRLARSARDLHNITHGFEQKGVHLRVLDQAIDTSTPAGRAMFGMIGVFAQFENDLRRERQLAGIALAKKDGVYRGHAHTVDVAKVQEMREAGMKPDAIAQQLGVGRTSVYRALKVTPDKAEEIAKEIADRAAKRAKKDRRAQAEQKAGKRKPAEPVRTSPALIIPKPTIKRIETHITVQPPPTPNRPQQWRAATKPEPKRPSRA